MDLTTKVKNVLITGSATAAPRDIWIEREECTNKFTERGGRQGKKGRMVEEEGKVKVSRK